MKIQQEDVNDDNDKILHIQPHPDKDIMQTILMFYCILGKASGKKYGIFWEFFPNSGPPPTPPFWEFRPFFADFFW